MARLWPIIAALASAVWREQRSLKGLSSNNLIWIIFLLGGSGSLILLAIGAVALVPLCADPFRKLPAERTATWPLTPKQLRLIRFISVFLSPASWLAIAAILWTQQIQYLLLAFLLAAFLIPFPSALAFRAVPGLFGELVRKNIRELITLLDPYVALLVSATTLAFRIARPGQLPAEALPIMSLIIIVTLSTSAQCLFALDAGPGLERYRLLPLRGWRVLAAKHAALAMVALPLAAIHDWRAALAGLLIALAFGNHMSVNTPRLQTRWSLTSGSLFPGLIQIVALCSAGIYAARESAWVIPFCALAYALSTFLYGWWFDRQR